MTAQGPDRVDILKGDLTEACPVGVVRCEVSMRFDTRCGFICRSRKHPEVQVILNNPPKLGYSKLAEKV